MKKRLFLSFILIFSLLLITGCGNDNNGENNKKEENIVDETLFTIKDKEFHLDTDKEFEGLKYKTSSEFKEIDNFSFASKYMQYNYQPDGSSNYFYFRIFYFKVKDFAYARKDLAIDDKFKYQDGTTDKIEYKMVDEERTDGTIHFYFISKDGNTFVLHFVSQNDIRDFEEKVLKSLEF